MTAAPEEPQRSLSARQFGETPGTPAAIDKYNEDAIHFSATCLPTLLAAELPSGPLALADLGCGDGRWFRILERRGYISSARPVYAVDLDRTRLSRVARRYPYITTIAAPAEDVSAIASASLDFVISTDVLEHIPDEARFLGEIQRILKSGGKAYLTSVFKKRWAWYFRKRNGESVLDTSHLREYTDLAVFRRLISASGLVLLHLETKLIWFPLLDPLAFRLLPREWAQDSRGVSIARLFKVPIAGYYHLNCVLTR